MEFRPPVSMATQGSDGGSNSRTHEMETGDAWGRMASKSRPISELWLQVRDSDLLYKVYMQYLRKSFNITFDLYTDICTYIGKHIHGIGLQTKISR